MKKDAEKLESYIGLLGNGNSELIEKRSRFIGACAAAYSEDEAQTFIEGRRKLMPDAGHHVYAYRIGKLIERYSDDGEPSGTAGMPVLNILKQSGIENAVVVVSRYFGGTLLGAGGLVHAYSRTGSAAVGEAVPVEKVLFAKLSVRTDYSSSGRIQYLMSGEGGIIVNTSYTEDVEFTVMWPPEARSAAALAADASSGRAVTSVLCRMYCARHCGEHYFFDR